MTMDRFQLVPAQLSDYPIIQNMARFYVYDMSEYMGDDDDWRIPEDGLYECFDLKKYWEQQETYPFIIRHNVEIAGFVIIDKKGSDDKVDYNMAQFFILRKFKNKGVGRQVAYECFNRFKGLWEVRILPQNLGGYQFWKKVITAYTDHRFQEYVSQVRHLDNAERIIFHFSSQ